MTLPSEILSEQSPRGAFYRALSAQFPHAVPMRDDLLPFSAKWMLEQDFGKGLLMPSDIVMYVEDWLILRKAGLS